MLRIQFAAMALATAALLTASGCGGSSKDASTTTVNAATTTPPTGTTPKVATGAPLTRAQLITRANTICVNTNNKRAAIVVVHPSEYARELPQAAIYATTETNELSELVPPAALAHDWSKLLDYFHLYAEYTNAFARYTQTHTTNTSGPLLEKAEGIHQRLATIATRDGLTHCATFK
jgi:hypothetical protein